jgi:alcohol dehydrogenase (cytochrome c)
MMAKRENSAEIEREVEPNGKRGARWMSNRQRILLTLAACTGLFIPAAAGQRSELPSSATSTRIDVRPDELSSQPVGANWLSYNGDYSGRRYSSLREINRENVQQLRAEWVFHASGADDMEVTPEVVDGVMFVGVQNDVFALDARTGRSIWHYSRPTTDGLIDDAAQHHNRGVGILHSRIYLETDNAHLLCVDGRSGHLLWDTPYAEGNKNYGATSAPLVIRDKVLVGTSGGDDGVRGFLAAFDAQTGKLAWRFWTIPGPGEKGSSSWPGDLYLHGGGTTWMPGTYDPELNLVYWGTSNPSPDFSGDLRPGDDLYTDCVLAIDPERGTLKWYFQFTPHDLFDYDATETPVLVDDVYEGEARKLLVEANRNGFIYVLDRVTGKFLAAHRFAGKLNWAKGVDRDGRPIRSGIAPTPQGAVICPGFSGATNWYSPSYNPDTHLMYFLSLDECAMFLSKKPEPFAEGRTYYATGVRHAPGTTRQKTLLAFNVRSGKFAWKYPQTAGGRSSSGVMSTAGSLVFFGDDQQSFEAVDAVTGEPLWHFATGQDIHASPMSYAVDGKQYVAIAAGTDLFAFALP